MAVVRMRTIRGPASYSTRGFPTTIGGPEAFAQSSSRMVSAVTITSSPYLAQVTSSATNVVNIRLLDSRSGGQEAAVATDVSEVGFAIVYEGV